MPLSNFSSLFKNSQNILKLKNSHQLFAFLTAMVKCFYQGLIKTCAYLLADVLKDIFVMLYKKHYICIAPTRFQSLILWPPQNTQSRHSFQLERLITSAINSTTCQASKRLANLGTLFNKAQLSFLQLWFH